MTIAATLLSAAIRAETVNVSLVLSDSTAPFQQFSGALTKALAASQSQVRVIQSNVTSTDAKIDLVVAVGMKATELAIANSKAPVLAVMLPKAGYETLLEKYPPQKSLKAISAIYLDQPWDRQLYFIQAALPGHSIVGMLYSPNTSIVLPRLPQGMSLNAKSVRSNETLFSALENILESSDVLLVIPDNVIYSSSNVRNILLASYRQKVPMVGISQAYVNAGALCAIFSTPEQLAWQTATTIISFIANKRLPEPQYPVSFSIGINQQVSTSLGIELAPPEVIRQRMDQAGEGRR